MLRRTLVTTTPVAPFRRLGTHNRPAIGAFEQLQEVVRARLGERHRRLLAEPAVDSAAGTVDWYTDMSGPAQRLADAPPDLRRALEAELPRLLDDLRALGANLVRAGEAGGANLLGAMLQLATTHPGPDAVYVVDGQPVLVLWGHESLDPKAPPTPFLPPAPEVSPTKPSLTWRDRLSAVAPWLRWLLVALLLLLLLLLLWLLLRGYVADIARPESGRPVPTPVAVTPTPPAAVPSAPSATTPPAPRDDDLAQAREREAALRAELDRLQRDYDAARASCPAPPRTGGILTPESLPPVPPTQPAPEIPPPPPSRPADLTPPAPTPSSPPPPSPAPPAPPPPPPPQKAECPPPRPPWESPEVVVVLDGSSSMWLPANMSQAEEEALLRRARGGDRSAAQRFAELVRSPGRKRIDDAGASIEQSLNRVPADVDIGFIAFRGCQEVVNHRFFKANERGKIMEYIKSLRPGQGTPLARAVERAGNIVGGAGPKEQAIIVIVTDGGETCGGDPCAAARRLKQAKPGVKINLVSLTENNPAACLASETGGQVVRAENVMQVPELIREMTQQPDVPPQCQPGASQ
ncbi:MAG: VWA domain-containing protein [Rhodospirillales bacterium]|nr:VWA domain-containing protein [Rhodospirillales bacterium]